MNRHLNDLQARSRSTNYHLGLDLISTRLQLHRPELVGAKTLERRLRVGDLRPKEQIQEPRESLVAVLVKRTNRRGRISERRVPVIAVSTRLDNKSRPN